MRGRKRREGKEHAEEINGDPTWLARKMQEGNENIKDALVSWIQDQQEYYEKTTDLREGLMIWMQSIRKIIGCENTGCDTYQAFKPVVAHGLNQSESKDDVRRFRTDAARMKRRLHFQNIRLRLPLLTGKSEYYQTLQKKSEQTKMLNPLEGLSDEELKSR